MGSPVSQASREKMIQLCNDGLTCPEVAIITGYSEPTCHKYVRAVGLEFQSRGIPVEDRERIIELYKEKGSVVEVSRETGYQVATCRKYLRAAGVEIVHTHPSRCPSDIETKIVAAYQGGASARVAAGKYGYSEGVGLSVLKRCGIERRRPPEQPSISEDAKAEIVQLYRGGMGYTQVASTTGYSVMTCWKYVRNVGAERIPIRYKCDKTAFDEINDEDSAYWLGFIYADGNVCNGILTLGLAYRDVEHVRKFRDFLSSNHPVVRRQSMSFDKPVESATLKVGRKYMCASLAKWGVVPAKSLVLKPPVGIADELMRHFWRGVVDGDGTIGTYIASSNGKPQWAIYLTAGNAEMPQGFLDFIHHNHIETNATVRQEKEHKFRVAFGGVRMAQEVASLLYEGATVYLDRKHELYKQCMATERLQYAIPENKIRELLADKSLGQEHIAEKLGVHRATVKRHCQYYDIDVDWQARASERHRTEFDFTEAVTLYAGGMSLRKVSKLVGITHPTLSNRFVQNGIELRTK